MDLQEQRGLVSAALAKIVHHNGLCILPSQNTPAKSYLVKGVFWPSQNREGQS